VPKYEDNETTLEELKARVAKTLDFIATLKPQQLQGSEERTINARDAVMDAEDAGPAIPDGFRAAELLLHATTAYALLRATTGLELVSGTSSDLCRASPLEALAGVP